MNTSNPHRLYRIKDKAIVFGVCAGIADYFDFNVTVVRIITVVALFVFQLPILFAYIIARLILKDKPLDLQNDVKKDAFWRSMRTAPSDTIYNLKHRFSSLEQRLRRAEKKVTSREFQLENDLH